MWEARDRAGFEGRVVGGLEAPAKARREAERGKVPRNGGRERCR